MVSPNSSHYDAIVVGSGISGGWAAKELTEKGLKVLLLERGKNVEHIKDYTNALRAPWEVPHRGRDTVADKAAHPIQRRDYILNESNRDWWADEKDSPYVEQKAFDWFRGYHVGGRSLMWGRQSYRHSDIDFEANAKEGVAVDWPAVLRAAEKVGVKHYFIEDEGVQPLKEIPASLRYLKSLKL